MLEGYYSELRVNFNLDIIDEMQQTANQLLSVPVTPTYVY
jgi:hypothetical protein